MPPAIIPLPDVVYSQADMRPVRPGNINQMEGRRTEEVLRGTPYWVLSLTAENLTTQEAASLDGFEMDALDGCLIAAHDPHRARPIAYGRQPLSGVKAGGGAFNGDAVLQSITNPLTIVVSGLPAGFSMAVGDYVEVRKSDHVRSLHRVRAAAVANASGVMTLSIRFFLDVQAFTLPCAVRFEKPTCLMSMDKGSFSAPKTWPNFNVSFSATEFFANGA